MFSEMGSAKLKRIVVEWSAGESAQGQNLKWVNKMET